MIELIFVEKVFYVFHVKRSLVKKNYMCSVQSCDCAAIVGWPHGLCELI